jgi:hypothetical protein
MKTPGSWGASEGEDDAWVALDVAEFQVVVRLAADQVAAVDADPGHSDLGMPSALTLARWASRAPRSAGTVQWEERSLLAFSLGGHRLAT